MQPDAPLGQIIFREENGPRGLQRSRHVEEQEPTVLHRMVSMAVIQFFVVLSVLWPYIQVFVRNAYELERQYHVSERFATQTWNTANAIGKQTVSTVNLVCTWNDGQVGETLESVFAWWIQGVAGGLCEGLGEGMEVLGLTPKRVSRKKRGSSGGYRA